EAKVEIDLARDATDLALFERAWADETPILGICRGLQVVNVARGGTLVQDIPSERPEALGHHGGPRDQERRDHTVRVTPGARLSPRAGADEIAVNSRHHQAVDEVGSGLSVSAVAPDGTVEGLETSGGRWCVAVQWHPENLAEDAPSRRLFEDF